MSGETRLRIFDTVHSTGKFYLSRTVSVQTSEWQHPNRWFSKHVETETPSQVLTKVYAMSYPKQHERHSVLQC